MRRALPTFAATLIIAACSDTLPVEQATPSGPRLTAAGETSGRYVVLLSNGANANDFATLATSLGGTVVALHQGAGFAVVDGLSASAATRLASQRGVQAVEPDLVAQVVQPVRAEAAAYGEDEVTAASQTNPATAFFFARQWNQRAIGATTAWAAGALGSSSVKVAILDSGIDDTYPDLAGLVDASRSASFVNTGSTNCLNPSDDQLINGRAASAACPVALPAFFPGKPAWADLNGHGTFTAGTVSSKAIVLAGVTSKVTLMAVKVLSARGSGSFSAILQGVAHATDKGADVINMSLGSVFLSHGGYIGYLNGITRYARSRGVTIVVAAGNDGIDLDHSGGVYASFCSSGMVICVSATGPTRSTRADGTPSVNGPLFLPSVDESAIYTNYGTSSVDVAAPGGNWAEDDKGNITSAVFVWGPCSRTALDYVVPTVPPGSPPGTLPAPPFYRKSICTTGVFATGAVGTSAAAPHVAGLAALLVPSLGRSPGEIRTRLQETADDLGKPGADPRYGKGRINVPRALGI